MHIFADKLSFETGSSSKTYDGTPLQNADYRLLSGTIQENHRLTVQMNAHITNAGTASNKPTVIILDHNGQDVTSWYYIDTTKSGNLTVEKAPLIITAGSATAKYVPGQALTCDTYTVDGAVAEGEVLTATTRGSQIQPGKGENYLSWENVSIHRNGVDTTGNYEITTVCGWLEVTAP
jgi:hypothetical protein